MYVCTSCMCIAAVADGHSDCWPTREELQEDERARARAERKATKEKPVRIKGAAELRANRASGQFLARTIILSRPIIYQPIMASNVARSAERRALSKVPGPNGSRHTPRAHARVAPLYFIEKLPRAILPLSPSLFLSLSLSLSLAFFSSPTDPDHPSRVAAVRGTIYRYAKFTLLTGPAEFPSFNRKIPPIFELTTRELCGCKARD